MKHILRAFTGLILLAALLLAASMVVLRPTVPVNAPVAPDQADITAFLTDAMLSTGEVELDLPSLSAKVTARLTDEQINQLLQYAHPYLPQRVRDHLTGWRAECRDGVMDLYVRALVLPFFEAEVCFTASLHAEDGRAVVADIVKERAGMISLKPGTLVSLELPELPDPARYAFDLGYIKPFHFESIELEPGGARVTLSLEASSFDEISEIARLLQ